MAARVLAPVLAAIDVGTNAVRLKLARPLPDGSIESLHEERDPVRPGEGVFKTRVMKREVADRLLSTLRRYVALCRRHNARVRAVATSAIREARNRDEILRRVRRECGLELEVISGTEEARLICLGVLRGRAPTQRALVIDVGGGSTEVAVAMGEQPSHLWTLALGSVRLTEAFDSSGPVSKKQLQLMRAFAAETVAEALPVKLLRNLGAAGARGAKARLPRLALGTSGSVRAVVGFAAAEGTAHATRKQLSRAVKDIAAMSPAERRTYFDPQRAEIVVAGAVIVEALATHLKLDSVTAVPSGLRDGVLVDLIRRRRGQAFDPSLSETAMVLGRRFAFAEAHARQVAALSLSLFDDLARVHGLPASLRSLLEVAALLHDVGHAVNYQKHHRHTFYLIINTDIPGLTDHQRAMVARIARYHRGSPPEASHQALEELTVLEVSQVRKLSMLLRLADSFDRSHHQPVRKVRATVRGAQVRIRLTARKPVDLELWDANHETALFYQVFRKRLDVGWTRG